MTRARAAVARAIGRALRRKPRPARPGITFEDW